MMGGFIKGTRFDGMKVVTKGALSEDKMVFTGQYDGSDKEGLNGWIQDSRDNG